MTVGVAELKAAWRALEAGVFGFETLVPGSRWHPDSTEQVLVVIGCVGSVGASTVALALAHATGSPARVVECRSAPESGYAAAASAELGDVDGWRRGSRGQVLIERLLGDAQTIPCATVVPTTIVDADASALRPDASGWLPALLEMQPPTVLVTRPTVPALRRLETCLGRLRDPLAAVVVVVGPAPKRWPRQVRCSMGVRTADLAQVGRLVAMPEDRTLAYTGITPDPLPTPLLRAGQETLILLGKEPS